MFGVTSSPFLLRGTLQHHISKYEEEDPEIVKKLLESFYVNDFNSGEENVEQAFELYFKSKKFSVMEDLLYESSHLTARNC